MPQRRTNRSMSGLQLLHKATKSDQYKFKIDNAMHGIFGETDTQKHVIKINKKLHAQKSGGHNIKNLNGTEKLIGTITHELIHAQHPRMHEKRVRKIAKKRVQKLSTKRKRKLYLAVNNQSTIMA